MAELPEIGIQPQARPVDEFVRPAAQRSVRGGDLLQLTAALKDFSAAGNEIYQRRADAYREGSAQVADQVSEAKQYQNMQALNGAVQAGQIPMWANPWFQVRLKQDTARNEVQLASKGIANDLQKSDVMHSDDPNAVHQFISQRFGSLMQGRDAWQVSAMAPEIGKARQQMMSDWLQTRGADRIREAHQATGTLVMQKLDGFDSVGYARGDPEATKSVDAMTADIQQQYNHLTNVVDKATASQWVSDAILEAAKTHRNADLARTLMENIKGQDGVKLSILGDNRFALQRLPREIAELQNGDLQAEITGKQLLGVKERQNLLTTAQGMMKEQGAANLWQVKLTPEQWQKLSPEGYSEVTKAFAAMAQESLVHKNTLDQYNAEPIIKDLLTKSVNGQLKMPDQISLMSALAAHGEPGRNYLETFARFLHYQRDMEFGSTSAATLQDLNTKAASGTLTMKDVIAHIDSRDIDQHTMEEWMQVASAIEAGGGVSGRNSQLVGRAINNLSNLVQAPYLEQQKLGGRGDSADADTMRLSEERAKTAFNLEFNTKLVKSPGWDKLSFAEQQKQVGELVDSISKTYGGQTMDDYLKARPEAIKPALPVEKPIQTGEKPKTGDPFAANLNAPTLSGIKQMLDYKPNTTLGEVMGMKDYFSVNPQSKLTSDQARYAANVLGQYRNEPATPDHTNPIRYNPQGRVAVDSPVFQKEREMWTHAMDQLQAFKPEAMEAKQTLLSIQQQYQASGSITATQQQTARHALITMMSFQELRDQLGYTAAEVKEAGEGGWRSMPMFANPLDLQERGPTVMKSLGIKPFEAEAFNEAQLRMMRELRETEK